MSRTCKKYTPKSAQKMSDKYGKKQTSKTRRHREKLYISGYLEIEPEERECGNVHNFTKDGKYYIDYKNNE